MTALEAFSFFEEDQNTKFKREEIEPLIPDCCRRCVVVLHIVDEAMADLEQGTANEEETTDHIRAVGRTILGDCIAGYSPTYGCGASYSCEQD